MEMICPECGHVEAFTKLPMRLQTCSTCSQDGNDTYLTVPSLEPRQPIPKQLPVGRVLLERRRLSEESPAV